MWISIHSNFDWRVLCVKDFEIKYLEFEILAGSISKFWQNLNGVQKLFKKCLNGVWFFGHFWNWFLLFLIAMIGLVFEFYPLPQVWESGFWKVRNVRLLGRKCPVSFHKILWNRQVSLLYLNYSRVQYSSSDTFEIDFCYL